MIEPSAPAGWDVFISYSNKDGGIHKKIKAALEAAGIRCWVAPDSIPAGESYASCIIDGIQKSKVLVFALSANSDVSLFCRQEVERANALGLDIIPFRIDNVKPSKELELALASRQWLDAFEGDAAYYLPALVNAVAKLLRKTTRPGITTVTKAPRKSLSINRVLPLAVLAILAVSSIFLLTRQNQRDSGRPAGTEELVQTLQEIRELASSNATNTASRLRASVGRGGAPEVLALLRASPGQDQAGDREKRAEISRALVEINRLLQTRPEARSRERSLPLIARPRVVTILPLKHVGAEAGVDATAANCTKALLETFSAQPGFLVVDRNHLDDILLEQGLNLSSLADDQARIEIGKLLPASLLVTGEITPHEGKSSLSLRLIDTASTRYLGTLTSPALISAELVGMVGDLALDLASRARRARPLEAPLLREGGDYVAGIGAFHGVDAAMRFQVFRQGGEGIMNRHELVGAATLLETGGAASTFRITWSGEHPREDLSGLFLREHPGE